MKIIQVFRIGFDTLENRIENAIVRELLGSFREKNGCTAIGNASDFIEKIEPETLYLAWDGKIYPQIIINEINVS